MARGKRYRPEQVVNLLRQIEVAVVNVKTTAQACKEAESHSGMAGKISQPSGIWICPSSTFGSHLLDCP
jgi:hypothetical protein